MARKSKTDTILIIEDDFKILQFATWVLELEGYHVLQAQNGDEGMRLVRESKVNLVLLDLRLPDRDGWLVLEEIKSSPELSAIPVIVCTASVDVPQRDKTLSMDAADYLVKPLSAEDLNNAVITCILGRER